MCNKRVPVETLPGQADVICFECKNIFVELISVHQPQAREVNDEDQPAFGNEFLQVLGLNPMAAREEDAPPLPPDRDGSDNDYLRIELDGWDENEDDDDDNENEEDENPNRVDQVHNGSDAHDENEAFM
ncbi:hypothetical protein L1987_21270 [Smallanthus sonchifolius]|uniref:Uncharacterized protein n=1 Tax=Smallanthus sonchifolius TaxID=185202 RepID=A0ACB9IVT0_9ASTR|nr:hypothetical protein L1987_21270 [Smallanthus sonchifolius]